MKKSIIKKVIGKLDNPVLFLGGTCNNSTWREKLIPLLEANDIKYFNPVVEDWTEEAQKKEEEIKNKKENTNLFVITKDMTGVFSIAEVVQSSNIKPEKTIFMILPEGFDKAQLKSLEAVKKLVKENGAHVIDSMSEIIDILK